MARNGTKRVVLYARISKKTEESVSIPRQLDACRKYAEGKGWVVVGEFEEHNKSASKLPPEKRPKWRKLMATSGWDIVLAWELERVIRQMSDFWRLHEQLTAAGRMLTTVEGDLDMSTADGQLFASFLAYRAQKETEKTSSRAAGARPKVIEQGRWPGGVPPFGWRVIDNPDGPGKVLAKDDDEFPVLREIVRRTREGHTLYSTVQWLNEKGVPTRSQRMADRGSYNYSDGRPPASRWAYPTLNRLVRHPLLAGMLPTNSGNNSPHHRRGEQVLRDPDTGMPVVWGHLRVMSAAEWRALLAQLDGDNTGNRKPRHLRAKTSGLLSGLVMCADCSKPQRMYRGTIDGRPGYYCKSCHQAMSNFEHLVIQQFLDHYGELPRMVRTKEVTEGGAAEAAEARAQSADLWQQFQSASGDRATEILGQIQKLKQTQEEAERQPGETVIRIVSSGKTWGQEWEAAEGDDEQRRAILRDAIDAVWIRRGVQGAHSDARKLERMSFEWKWDEALSGEDAQRWDATIEAAHGADRMPPEA